MTKLKILGIVIAGIVISVFISAVIGNKEVPPSDNLQGVYNQVVQYFNQGLKAGTSNQLVISNTGAITTSGNLAVTGTTTITKSPDGFVAYMGFTMATGTAKAVYTNPSSDLVCDARSGAFTGLGTTFAPSLVVALGTSTTATGYSVSLLASTTLATTTDNFFGTTYTAPFRLRSGDSIVGALSDLAGMTASSTYYSNWSMGYGVQCRVAGL